MSFNIWHTHMHSKRWKVYNENKYRSWANYACNGKMRGNDGVKTSYVAQKPIQLLANLDKNRSLHRIFIVPINFFIHGKWNECIWIDPKCHWCLGTIQWQNTCKQWSYYVHIISTYLIPSVFAHFGNRCLLIAHLHAMYLLNQTIWHFTLWLELGTFWTDAKDIAYSVFDGLRCLKRGSKWNWSKNES